MPFSQVMDLELGTAKLKVLGVGIDKESGETYYRYLFNDEICEDTGEHVFIEVVLSAWSSFFHQSQYELYLLAKAEGEEEILLA